MKRIERKLEKIETEILQMRMHLLTGDLAETPTLIDLPDHLRKTAMGLLKIKEGRNGRKYDQLLEKSTKGDLCYRLKCGRERRFLSL